MNQKTLFTFLLSVCFGWSYAQLDRSKLPEPATPRPIEIGDYEQFELKNGLKVFVIENHKLPRVSYNLLIDREPLMEGDKIGYLGMVGSMLRRGTETRTKEQIDEEIDFIGATLAGGSSNVFASGLSKYAEQIMELMTDVAFNPTFPEDELEKIRTQTISGLASQKDDPDAIAGNLAQRLVYGSDHPYGEIQTEETTNNIQAEDLRNYHSQFFKPNISYLAIVGDVNPKEVKKMVKKYFGAWQNAEVEAPTYEDPGQPASNQVSLVNRSNAVQSVINITYPIEFLVASEDEIKVRVMNQILGGGFSGKLNMNLREDKGYTYGSRSSLSSDELIARFNASVSVRNEVTDSAIVQMFYEIEQMRAGEISEDELRLAKNAIAGSFSRSLEQPQTVASFALNSALYAYPDNYYATYTQKVQAVTIEDVKKMANKYLMPENAYINVVGKASEVAEKLEQFGPVKYYDTYGNEIDPSMTKVPDGLTAEGVIEKYKEAIGGDDALAQFKNVSVKMSAEMMGQQMQIDMLAAQGRKSKVTVSMGPMVALSAISDGNNASTVAMGGKAPMTDVQKEELIYGNGLYAEFDLLENGASVKLVGVEQIDEKDAYVVEVALSKGGKYSLYFDAESGLKVRFSKVLETPQGTFNQIIDYGDYRAVDGLMIFHSFSQQMGPQQISAKASEVVVNGELPEGTFKVE